MPNFIDDRSEILSIARAIYEDQEKKDSIKIEKNKQKIAWMNEKRVKLDDRRTQKKKILDMVKQTLKTKKRKTNNHPESDRKPLKEKRVKKVKFVDE